MIPHLKPSGTRQYLGRVIAAGVSNLGTMADGRSMALTW